MPPVATVTGWGRVGPEEAAPMSPQLLVTQVRVAHWLMPHVQCAGAAAQPPGVRGAARRQSASP